MQLSLRTLLLPAALLAGLGLLTPVTAKGPPDGFRIKDDGNFFKKEAIDKANAVIASIKRETKKDVLIETYKHPPEGQKARYEREAKTDQGKQQFFAEWLGQRMTSENAEGVGILICRDPEYLIVETSKKTEMNAFSGAERREVRNILIDFFKKQEYDTGLTAAVGYIKGKLITNAGGSASATTAAPVGGGQRAQKEGGLMGGGILGWVCAGVGVLLALWIVFGVIRAISGAGRPVERPPGNYAGGYGPGGGGYGPAPASGGGGFMSSMLGGMLGAGAGMWAYDTFFRGGSSGPSMTPPAYGGGTPIGSNDPQPGGADGGSWGSGTPSTGGDVGGDWGGGSAEPTGGDWSSGGDAGTGGDWGRGDAGGGDAGGDWGGGGGGGGDAGGDWGGGGDGGGGGGDW